MELLLAQRDRQNAHLVFDGGDITRLPPVNLIRDLTTDAVED